MVRAGLITLFAAVVSASNSAGRKFLEENKGKDGVVTQPSGLQYKVISSGGNSAHPTASSPCSCHYEGRTAQNYPDGPVFDSSYARGAPSTFAPNQVIKGWTEAMQLMSEGDKWELYIPSELAYGDNGRPPIIGGGDVLIFTLEMLKIIGPKASVPGGATLTAHHAGDHEADEIKDAQGESHHEDQTPNGLKDPLNVAHHAGDHESDEIRDSQGESHHEDQTPNGLKDPLSVASHHKGQAPSGLKDPLSESHHEDQTPNDFKDPLSVAHHEDQTPNGLKDPLSVAHHEDQTPNGLKDPLSVALHRGTEDTPADFDDPLYNTGSSSSSDSYEYATVGAGAGGFLGGFSLVLAASLFFVKRTNRDRVQMRSATGGRSQPVAPAVALSESKSVAIMSN